MQSSENPQDFGDSLLLQAVRDHEEEVLRHKWIESEKAGKDVGYGFARIDWNLKHRRGWLDRKRKAKGEGAGGR